MKSIVEYIWLGGKNELRSKTRILQLDTNINLLEQIPNWNYDGSSTGQVYGTDSEVIIKPCAIFKDPFKCENGFLVMCDTYKPNDTPLENNFRPWAKQIFDKKLDEEPWYGIEQEYFIMNRKTNMPLGYPLDGYPRAQGPYYCSVGTMNAHGRQLVDEHLKACLDAGIKICGANAEVAIGQWEYQIGPCTGINAGDHLWVSRYILERLSEKYGYVICWHPKPVKGDWNGSGCHTNYSTKNMREGCDGRTGLDFINDAIEKLSKNHKEHINCYGIGNELRMTGEHETSSMHEFSYGVGNRGASIRIGNETMKNEKGYFEDRRPCSNMNPYLVTAKLFETTVLE